MRSRIRFLVLPWEFFLAGKDSRGDHGLGRLVDLGLRPLLVFHLPAYDHSHHRDNVVAPHGRPNLRSRLHYRHNQEGNHESSQEHVMALGGGGNFLIVMH